MTHATLEPIEQLTDAHVDDLLQLYQHTSWWGQQRQRSEIEQMLAQTHLVLGLQDSETGKMVAFCRVLFDGLYRGTVYDVMVTKAYQGLGVGRQLMEAVVAHPRLQQVEHIDLSCLPEMMPFYSKFGFQPITEVQFMRWHPQAAANGHSA